jgi:hypothetical protein
LWRGKPGDEVAGGMEQREMELCRVKRMGYHVDAVPGMLGQTMQWERRD